MTRDDVIQDIENVASYLGEDRPYAILIKEKELPELLNMIILEYVYWNGFSIPDDFMQDDLKVILEAFETIKQEEHFNFDKNGK